MIIMIITRFFLNFVKKITMKLLTKLGPPALSYPFNERLLQYRLQCCQFKISMYCYVIKHFSNYDHNKEALNVVPFLSLLLGAKWKYGETGAAGI